MADEDVAKQVRRGETYIEARSRMQSAFAVLDQIKSQLAETRVNLVAEFGMGSPQVVEADALVLALKNALTNFSNRF
jgi:hypothetical protein